MNGDLFVRVKSVKTQPPKQVWSYATTAMQGSGRKKEMRVTAAFRLGDKENDDLVSSSSRIVKRVTQVRFFASSTLAPVLSWRNYLALDEWVLPDKW